MPWYIVYNYLYAAKTHTQTRTIVVSINLSDAFFSFPCCLRLSCPVASASYHSASLLLHQRSAEFRRVMASPLLLAGRSDCVSLWQQMAGEDSVFQVLCGLESVTGRAGQTVSRGRGITDSYTDTSRITGHINCVH